MTQLMNEAAQVNHDAKATVIVDQALIDQIKGCDAFDLLELILKRPELVSNPETLQMIRQHDDHLKSLGW